METARNIVVGVSGASGAMYARRLIQCLCSAGVHTDLVVTPNGRRLFSDELQITEVCAETLTGAACEELTLHPYRDVGAPIGSGSYPTMGMIVCPCSTNTLGAIAAGLGDNLLNRAASVTIKERRRLVLVLREMPLSAIDLHNCLRVVEAGGIICPASPGFYMMPRSLDDLVDFVVGKVLDLVDVPHTLNTRWVDQLAAAESARNPA